MGCPKSHAHDDPSFLRRIKDRPRRADGFAMPSRRFHRPFPSARALACVSALVLALVSTGATTGGAATGASVVGATVLAATEVDVSGCVAGGAGTAFGGVPVGTSTRTATTCDVSFRSTNTTASLRMRQADGAGAAMWRATNGELDPGFGTGGTIVHDLSSVASWDYAGAIVADRDGRVVSVGKCANGARIHMCAVRLLADGSLDPTFNGGAPALFDPSHTLSSNTNNDSNHATDVEIDEAGRIVMSGTCNSPGQGHDFCVARFEEDGSPDTSFGTGGYAVYQPEGTTSFTAHYAHALTLLRDGRFVVGGICHVSGAPMYRDPCAVWFDADGRVDTTRGAAAGTTIVTHPDALTGTTRIDTMLDLVELPDGKLLGGGSCTLSDGTAWACLYRFTANGQLDTTFGPGATPGFVTHAFLGGPARRFTEFAMDGTTHVLASAQCGSGQMCVARLALDGSLDTAWGASSGVTAATTTADLEYSVAIERLPTGQLDLVGLCRVWNAGTSAYDQASCITRFDRATGAQDLTFGTSGSQVDVFDGALFQSSYQYIFADAALATDGSYVFAGNCWPSGSTGLETCFHGFEAGTTFADYGTAGATWGGAGGSHFGVCLDGVTNAATVDWSTNAGCAMSDAPVNGWRAVPAATAVVLARTPSASPTFGTARLRFGLRTGAATPSGSYAAPIRFEVVAP